MGNSSSISKSKKNQSLKTQEIKSEAKNFEVPPPTDQPKNKLEKSPEVIFEVPTQTKTQTKPDNNFDDEEYDQEEERDQFNEVIDIKTNDAKEQKIKGISFYLKNFPIYLFISRQNTDSLYPKSNDSAR